MFKTIQYFTQLALLLLGIPGIAANTMAKLRAPSTVGVHAVAHGETFIRVKSQVGGTQPLIDQQTDFEKGVTNVDKGRLQHAQQVNSIRFGYDEATTASNTLAQNLLYDKIAPASFNSATIVIKQGKELNRLPVASLVCLPTVNPMERFYNLDVPLTLNNTEDFDVTLEFAAGAVAKANTDAFVYVCFKGPRTNV